MRREQIVHQEPKYCQCEENVTESVVLTGQNECGEKTVINIVASCEDVTENGKILPFRLKTANFFVLLLFLTWINTLDDSESGSASTVGVVGVVSVLFVVLILSALLLIQRKWLENFETEELIGRPR